MKNNIRVCIKIRIHLYVIYVAMESQAKSGNHYNTIG